MADGSLSSFGPPETAPDCVRQFQAPPGNATRVLTFVGTRGALSGEAREAPTRVDAGIKACTVASARPNNCASRSRACFRQSNQLPDE
eukprot:3200384-Alexandrium_andersonii.AAC.1